MYFELSDHRSEQIGLIGPSLFGELIRLYFRQRLAANSDPIVHRLFVC
jgi:hypothetical protein